MVATPPPPLLKSLPFAFLTLRLLLTDRPTLGLPEYKLEIVNICKMGGGGAGDIEVMVL